MTNVKPIVLRKGRGSMRLLIAASLTIVLIAAIAQTAAGSYNMSWREAWNALTDAGVWRHPAVLLRFLLGEAFARAHGFAEMQPLDTTTLIVWNVRLPRVLTALMVGINLAFSGSIFQAVTRNELASPYLLGVSSGAGLAILVVLVLYPALGPLIPLAAMAGGTLAFLIVYAIAWNRGTSPVRLVLGGVIVGAIAGSLQTGIFFLARDISVMQNALAWTVGSLTGADWRQVRMILPWTIITVVLGLSASRNLDVLLLGEANARALGMAVERNRFLLAAVAIMAAGSSVAVAGLVGFVGLIVPHVVRSLVGSAHRRLLVGCLFAGPALMTSADAFARLIASPVQIPVGIVTGLLGGVFFLYLMRQRREIGKP
ncbi:MAG: iron ABC transporter permease [Terracidiphilus sp.]|nr:iron ABC transporter permease [Terracidiphilus sp.]MDR3799098.1 iron ABC transporter permease [Terracidiphilus sp.]